MTIEQVLSFFDHHNTAIIEGLVAIIILFGLYLGYRGFFAKDEQHGAGHGMDTAELEKTLQKILDNQASSHAGASSRRARDGDSESVEDFKEMPREKATSAPVAAAEVVGVVGESPAEIQQLRLTLSESQKKIEVLQAQLTVAETKVTEAEAASAAAPAPTGSGPNPEMEGRLRDLEARLAEYEIISEDIADLSRYRDENEKLKAEIDALKSQGGGSSAPPASSSEEPVVVAPAPVAEAAPAVDLSALDVDAAALIAEAESTDTSAAPSADLIDDDLMKEFAAAVEGQKALDKVGEKAGDGSAQAEKKSDENSELMNEFENFVSKKS